ncbi:Epoxyqueuosine reductase [Candidatus Magnetaquicoccaceae bacterium FCR-1]|uniref:Epoxyqueuosine reductase n=1 Tax=Candidatus Magnetaquiglobus chichijimensis TaxID=3141448 RepID=A0ABQ0C6K7_9PROT
MTNPDDIMQFNNPWERRKEALRAQAIAMGFALAGFAALRPPPRAEALTPWLEAGRHGGMAWLARSPEKRADPGLLLGTEGVLMVLGWHFPNQERDRDRDPACGVIAAYAQRTDYHIVLKEKTEALAAWLEREMGTVISHRSFVDTAPLLEKPLAMAAGLGWQGKNTLLVTRRFGCRLMLAELFLPVPISPDAAGGDHCGRCDRCQRACPTGALNRDYQIDAGRCLAYLTVEHRGSIPESLRTALGNRIFGCDACITACPWNRFAPLETPPPSDLAQSGSDAPFNRTLTEWAELDETAFQHRFAGTPVQRIGRVRLLRNIATALGNWDDPGAIPPLRRLLEHPSPLVREHAAWALEKQMAK